MRRVLRSPLAGWALPLAQVPDPVFAQGTVGEGVGIDPTEGLLHAPCDGRIEFLAGHRHALSLHADGLVLLLHVGIDTVGLHGEGFEPLVADGDRVRAGQPLLRLTSSGWRGARRAWSRRCWSARAGGCSKRPRAACSRSATN